MVYELSTGNNRIQGMTWDAGRNALTRYQEAELQGEAYVGDDYFDDMDDEIIEDAATPAHTEDYFGYMFDAGEHRIFRYGFKDQADPTVLPSSGRKRKFSFPLFQSDPTVFYQIKEFLRPIAERLLFPTPSSLHLHPQLRSHQTFAAKSDFESYGGTASPPTIVLRAQKPS
ncbi:hypothetical protein B0H17DRAFT_1142864 [Mycena rosella]|uniref:Uncharacterized protein n=1 Tax=Mycena rosella TaxID=1033263 RepID=A0AAD7G4P9_MYCRO|nr:hypothetical protein B0H17DRAFT_1142864 [Mycena rosella]